MPEIDECEDYRINKDRYNNVLGWMGLVFGSFVLIATCLLFFKRDKSLMLHPRKMI